MEVAIFETSAQVAEAAAGLVVEMVQLKPKAVLGFATGSTPLATYDVLKHHYLEGKISFAEVSGFNLDEYLGLAPDSKQSYRAYMDQHLFEHIDIKRENTFLPSCPEGENPHGAGLAYEQEIVARGGIDLQILGIGANGHIGFNEPSSSLASRTRVKTLAQKTIADNSRLFAPGEFQPQLAMTMGIATILDAKRVLLLATGKNKAQAVAQMIEGAIMAKCPASALQLHESVTVLLDEAAASSLQDKDYYQFVQEQNTKLTHDFGSRLQFEWQQ